MCASRSLSVEATLPLTDEEWDEHRLQELTDFDNVESLSKFLCLFQVNAEAWLKVDDILPHLNKRMYGLLTVHEREVLNNPSTPNRDKLGKLFMEYLPSKGRDHQTILQNFYLSLRDSSEDRHLQNHYLLAKQMAEQVQGKTKFQDRERIQRDSEELLRRLPPKSLDPKTATQLLRNLDTENEEVIERNVEVREICHHWLSQQKNHNGAAEKLVQALLCTEGLGYMVSYLCVSSWSNPPDAVAAIRQLDCHEGCRRNWKRIADFWGYDEKYTQKIETQLLLPSCCQTPMRILLRALRIPDFGNHTRIAEEAAKSILQRTSLEIIPSGLQAIMPSCFPPLQIPDHAQPVIFQQVVIVSPSDADRTISQLKHHSRTSEYSTNHYKPDALMASELHQGSSRVQVLTADDHQALKGQTKKRREPTVDKTLQPDGSTIENGISTQRIEPVNNANTAIRAIGDRIRQATGELMRVNEESNTLPEQFDELDTLLYLSEYTSKEGEKKENKYKSVFGFISNVDLITSTLMKNSMILLTYGPQHNERVNALQQRQEEQARQIQQLNERTQERHQERSRQIQELQQQHQEASERNRLLQQQLQQRLQRQDEESKERIQLLQRRVQRQDEESERLHERLEKLENEVHEGGHTRQTTRPSGQTLGSPQAQASKPKNIGRKISRGSGEEWPMASSSTFFLSPPHSPPKKRAVSSHEDRKADSEAYYPDGVVATHTTNGRNVPQHVHVQEDGIATDAEKEQQTAALLTTAIQLLQAMQQSNGATPLACPGPVTPEKSVEYSEKFSPERNALEKEIGRKISRGSGEEWPMASSSRFFLSPPHSPPKKRAVSSHEDRKADSEAYYPDGVVATHTTNGGRKYQLHIYYPTMANCDEQIVTAVGISYSNGARERFQECIKARFKHLSFICPRSYPLSFRKQSGAAVISIDAEHIPSGLNVFPDGAEKIFQDDVDVQEEHGQHAPFIPYFIYMELRTPPRMVQLFFTVRGIVEDLGPLSVVINFAVPH